MAERDTIVERLSSVALARGMYVLRYMSAGGAGAGAHPVAMVRALGSPEAKIEIISAPGVVAGRLDQQGACLVVRAEAAGDLQISLRPRYAGGPLEASLKLESIGTSDGGAVVASPSFEAPAIANAPFTFSLLAHLARRGDVGISAGQWAGGPDAPTPIEGIEIRAETRAEARLEIQALISGRPPRWTDWTGPGSFAGSRGRGLALVGVRLRIVGNESDQFEIGADALFLGAPVTSKRGRALEFVGGAGADALVGLRLNVWRDNEQNEKLTADSRRPSREPRVRIFRASALAER